MKPWFLPALSFIVFSSCQKGLADLTPTGPVDSTARAGQLIGMKVYYLQGADTIPADYYEFKYDDNPKRLMEYHHTGNEITRQFNMNIDTADKIWTYDNNGLLAEESGFYNGINNITYTNKVNRAAGGGLINFDYQNASAYTDCSTLQPLVNTGRLSGIFSTQMKNGLRTIHYIDTLAGNDAFGNQDCDYTIYFDAAGRVQMKIINGIMLRDERSVCTRFTYFPVNDTAKQFFYDPSTGKLQKSILTYYSGHVGPTPEDLERVTYTFNYVYDAKDNQKIPVFFAQYIWGKDLQSWFTYGTAALGSVWGGVDDEVFFPPEFQHLNYGVCDKINFTIESFAHHVSEGKYVYEYLFKKDYDAKGNLIHYSIVNGAVNNYYYEFIYK